MLKLLIMVVLAGLGMGQTIPTLAGGKNNLLHVPDPLPGVPGIRLEPVSLPAGWDLVSIGGSWVLSGPPPATVPVVPPPGPVLQGQTAWVTMIQGVDPLTWCLGGGVGPTAGVDVQPSLLDIRTQLTTPSGQIGAGIVSVAQGFLRVQRNPDPSQVNPGLVSSVPPIWGLDTCGVGLPGVTFPPGWTIAGEIRTSVQVLVVY